MTLQEYFDQTRGMGILATAGAGGRVNAAVYGRPHVQEDETVAFVMADRLSHLNLQFNPHAVYLFREEGAGYHGKRLYLAKEREEKDSPLIDQIRRRTDDASEPYKPGARYLVFFRVEKVLPLVGDTE